MVFAHINGFECRGEFLDSYMWGCYVEAKYFSDILEIIYIII
jgi:hypothetical protein